MKEGTEGDQKQSKTADQKITNRSIGAGDVGGVVDDCWWDTSAEAADFCYCVHAV